MKKLIKGPTLTMDENGDLKLDYSKSELTDIGNKDNVKFVEDLEEVVMEINKERETK